MLDLENIFGKKFRIWFSGYGPIRIPDPATHILKNFSEKHFQDMTSFVSTLRFRVCLFKRIGLGYVCLFKRFGLGYVCLFKRFGLGFVCFVCFVCLFCLFDLMTGHKTKIILG